MVPTGWMRVRARSNREAHGERCQAVVRSEVGADQMIRSLCVRVRRPWPRRRGSSRDWRRRRRAGRARRIASRGARVSKRPPPRKTPPPSCCHTPKTARRVGLRRRSGFDSGSAKPSVVCLFTSQRRAPPIIARRESIVAAGNDSTRAAIERMRHCSWPSPERPVRTLTRHAERPGGRGAKGWKSSPQGILPRVVSAVLG
jgi:hypothetical protein